LQNGDWQNHCDQARSRREQNVNPKTSTEAGGEVREEAEKPLSLRYAEIVKLREAIERAQSSAKSWGFERCASK